MPMLKGNTTLFGGKIDFGVIFELKNTTCIKAKFDFSTMKLWKVHLNEIQNKNICNLV